jgi:hypothetical protein
MRNTVRGIGYYMTNTLHNYPFGIFKFFLNLLNSSFRVGHKRERTRDEGHTNLTTMGLE